MFSNLVWSALLTIGLLCNVTTSQSLRPSASSCPTKDVIQVKRGCRNKTPGLTCTYQFLNSTTTQDCSFTRTCTCNAITKRFNCLKGTQTCTGKSVSVPPASTAAVVTAATTTTTKSSTTTTKAATTTPAAASSSQTSTACPSYSSFVATKSCPQVGKRCWYSKTDVTSTGTCLVNSACVCNELLVFDCKVARTGGGCI